MSLIKIGDFCWKTNFLKMTRAMNGNFTEKRVKNYHLNKNIIDPNQWLCVINDCSLIYRQSKILLIQLKNHSKKFTQLITIEYGEETVLSLWLTNCKRDKLSLNDSKSRVRLSPTVRKLGFLIERTKFKVTSGGVRKESAVSRALLTWILCVFCSLNFNFFPIGTIGSWNDMTTNSFLNVFHRLVTDHFFCFLSIESRLPLPDSASLNLDHGFHLLEDLSGHWVCSDIFLLIDYPPDAKRGIF